MFEHLFAYPKVVARHHDGPEASKRLRYLKHLADQRAARETLLRTARELLLESTTVIGTQAMAMRLVGEVVDPDAFPARLIAYCESLAALPPLTLRLTKRSLRNATRHVDLEGHLRYELANLLRAFDTEASKSARATRLDRDRTD